MPRTTKAANRPGTERYRDERRNDPKPKMHGKQWHDHGSGVEGEQGSHLGSAQGVTRPSGETVGMVKARASTRGGGKRGTPVGKGRAGEKATARAGAARTVKAGTKAPRRRA
jgi:hypothetical protein